MSLLRSRSGGFDNHANQRGNHGALLEQLSEAMMLSSMCGLGQAVPNPVMDSLQYFRGDYENRIREYQGGVTA